MDNRWTILDNHFITKDAVDSAFYDSGDWHIPSDFQRWTEAVGADVHAPTVYRIYSGDKLIYVGRTICLADRLRSHYKGPFGKEVTRIEQQQFPDLDSMCAAERLLISLFKPKYNRT